MRARGINTSTALQTILNNPMIQSKYQQMAGRDNRAIQSFNRELGNDIANMQERNLRTDAASNELSRRADRLEFAKKGMDYEREAFERRIGQREQARGLQQQMFEEGLDFDILKGEQGRDISRRGMEVEQDLFGQKMSLANRNMGLEIGLGLLGTGVNVYRNIQERRRHTEYMNNLRQFSYQWRNPTEEG